MSKRPLAVVLITALATFFMTLFALEFTSADEELPPLCSQVIAANLELSGTPCLGGNS